MNKKILIVIGTLNTLLWLLISAVNYRGIYRQIKSEFVSVIIWSIFILLAYLLILYSGTLIILRTFSILKYRKIKAKYVDRRTFIKQVILFYMAVGYIYGVCYQHYFFMGLIPMMLFFGKKILQPGKFFLYHNGQLIMIDEKSSEYIVKSMNSMESSIQIQDKKSTSMKEINLKIHSREILFLDSLFIRLNESKEVA